MTLSIGVLTIGSELLSGEMADTNTCRIAAALAGHGYRVREAWTVADGEADIEEALLALAERRQAVIVTGGLGPTADDLTARAAARAFRRHYVLNEEALQQIRDHFRRTGREMHPRNEKQALLPQKATIIPNPTGSAPGFSLQHNGRTLFFSPAFRRRCWSCWPPPSFLICAKISGTAISPHGSASSKFSDCRSRGWRNCCSRLPAVRHRTGLRRRLPLRPRQAAGDRRRRRNPSRPDGAAGAPGPRAVSGRHRRGHPGG